jgi:hypothetical protein
LWAVAAALLLLVVVVDPPPAAGAWSMPPMVITGPHPLISNTAPGCPGGCFPQAVSNPKVVVDSGGDATVVYEVWNHSSHGPTNFVNYVNIVVRTRVVATVVCRGLARTVA